MWEILLKVCVRQEGVVVAAPNGGGGGGGGGFLRKRVLSGEFIRRENLT